MDDAGEKQQVVKEDEVVEEDLMTGAEKDHDVTIQDVEVPDVERHPRQQLGSHRHQI